jgi:hypothetical protein
MSNGNAMALLESCKGNGNGPAMGLQCVWLNQKKIPLL